ncbi:MAG: hypothetical protein UW24_C0022G0012 [Parcubacteria group bacterium GW2011_GWA2_44_12]|nr:MAG: hypothetical protein UW24_C0022G0012 [Parcubacteria group bacterium GW2011_GWA2_44_12]
MSSSFFLQLVFSQKFAIPFARPRSHALKLTKEFFDWETRVAGVLESN